MMCRQALCTNVVREVIAWCRSKCWRPMRMTLMTATDNIDSIIRSSFFVLLPPFLQQQQQQQQHRDFASCVCSCWWPCYRCTLPWWVRVRCCELCKHHCEWCIGSKAYRTLHQKVQLPKQHYGGRYICECMRCVLVCAVYCGCVCRDMLIVRIMMCNMWYTCTYTNRYIFTNIYRS